MKEKGAGADQCLLIKKPELPKDSELYGKIGSFEMYSSAEKQEIIIKVVEYHAGDLYLSRSELEKLLGKISK